MLATQKGSTVQYIKMEEPNMGTCNYSPLICEKEAKEVMIVPHTMAKREHVVQMVMGKPDV